MKLHSTKRKKQAALTKQRILDCATKLFNKYDFDSVSMEDIAQAANSSIGGIYHHFDSKEAIAAYPIITYDHKYLQYYQERSNDPEYGRLSAYEKLKEYMVFVQNTCISNKNLSILYISALQRREICQYMISVNRNYTRILFDLIAKCRSEGFIKESCSDEEMIHIVTRISRGLFLDWLINEGSFDMETATVQLLDGLFFGVKPDQTNNT